MQNIEEKKSGKTVSSFKELPEAKNIKHVPAGVKGIIAEFTNLPTLVSFSQTNRENNIDLAKIREVKLKELEKQWYDLLAGAPEFKAYQKISIENFLRLLISRDEVRVKFWQYVISQKAFMLIDYLIQKKINLNPWIEHFKDNKSLSYIGGRTAQYHTCTHTVLDKEFKALPLNTEVILYLIQLGAKVSTYNLTSCIIPGVDRILNSTEQYSNSCVTAAGKLLVMAWEKGILDEKYLIGLLRRAKDIKHPVIKQIEAAFLIRQLEFILPSPWNFIADQRDAPLIRTTIAHLRQIVALPQIDDKNIELLEQFKNALESGAVPGGALFKCLQNLQIQGLITLQKDAKSSICHLGS
ncbi:MAG TPA: hypothetical protein VHE99_08550 [Gammaproteobacteria bacterium]|nr:hypothetical protein [Gammaproteobacteria bacterium]